MLSTNTMCKDNIKLFDKHQKLNYFSKNNMRKNILINQSINYFCQKYFAYIDIMEEYLARRYNAQD